MFLWFIERWRNNNKLRIKKRNKRWNNSGWLQDRSQKNIIFILSERAFEEYTQKISAFGRFFDPAAYLVTCFFLTCRVFRSVGRDSLVRRKHRNQLRMPLAVQSCLIIVSLKSKSLQFHWYLTSAGQTHHFLRIGLGKWIYCFFAVLEAPGEIKIERVTKSEKYMRKIIAKIVCFKNMLCFKSRPPGGWHVKPRTQLQGFQCMRPYTGQHQKNTDRFSAEKSKLF